ncbi:hypothetical protein jhhlp_001370 [Lomentospora prolificans]|uniref:DNA/RNA-binding domain-containing protein n=1 Tax=Lomentospora prolificans TaxID=41688 RepID=A0A2N3NI28_9PEZI|nr:hypothetical protein jhhlp_001370 [Lomentospora prolificans]
MVRCHAQWRQHLRPKSAEHLSTFPDSERPLKRARSTTPAPEADTSIESYLNGNGDIRRVQHGPIQALPVLEIVRQPITRPVTFDQLVSEIRGIYAALVKAEDECIERVSHLSKEDAHIPESEWKLLVELHQTALYEFCDFFFATHHPVAAESSQLAHVITKYSMPARLWRHAIYKLLDLMRKHLPDSRPHMYRFITLAFNMITILYENATDLCDIWAECLGDIARFRMAVESESVEDRNLYVGISKYWYYRSIDLAPGVGQRYHHIAILSRPALMGQLLNFTKSLCTRTPFQTARETILTLFTQVSEARTEGSPLVEILLVKVHESIMQDYSEETFEDALQSFLQEMNKAIRREGRDFKQFAYALALTNVNALLSYGSPQNSLAGGLGVPAESTLGLAFEKTRSAHNRAFQRALNLTAQSLNTILHHNALASTTPHLHVMLAFFSSVIELPYSKHLMTCLHSSVNWSLLRSVLKGVLQMLPPDQYPKQVYNYDTFPGILRNVFGRESRVAAPLPEDYDIRGCVWEERYLPLDWFDDDARDHDERRLEAAWMEYQRGVRCAWLGNRIAAKTGWLSRV